jgi:hypothetical protein
LALFRFNPKLIAFFGFCLTLMLPASGLITETRAQTPTQINQAVTAAQQAVARSKNVQKRAKRVEKQAHKAKKTCPETETPGEEIKNADCQTTRTRGCHDGCKLAKKGRATASTRCKCKKSGCFCTAKDR